MADDRMDWFFRMIFESWDIHGEFPDGEDEDEKNTDFSENT